MAAALRAAEGGGVYFFQILRRGVFSKFFRPGGVYPLPPIPDPCSIGLGSLGLGPGGPTKLYTHS